MSVIICVLCFCYFLSSGSAVDGELASIFKKSHITATPLLFPVNSDSSVPILVGEDPKQNQNLPPRMFPSESSEHNGTGPPILSGTEANITEIKHNIHEAKINSTHENTTTHSSSVEEKSTKPEDRDKNVSEADDMLQSKYKGGEDVDEKYNTPKKATEKDEKKEKSPKIDPNSEVVVSSTFDKKGPKLMNDTKPKGESMFESTSKVMAVSSSVLSHTREPEHHGIIEPAKTLVTVLLSAVVVLCMGAIGLLVWKRIAMRRIGRDVLINEDDFDEVSDMHTFDRAQIQIT